ncbi:DUF3566 domain-containing protein [Streptomyces echinatus]|uniref:DUF3566 domain-containing protein n=1 Tax=Streptomyces echinatus TaxID=67293 RepID=A0A7W9PT69_9ACTN|nr:DUF3566 domain-containing protein [Streptomyces echinatus]MBB5926832.1 hypothetical protein [Streptomyces echinatus]
MVTSSVLLAGLGLIAVVTACVVWVMVDAMIPEALPALTTVLSIAGGVVALEVVLGTGLATLCAFLYNLSALYSGGVEIAVTDGPDGPAPPAPRSLPRLARARVRVRRYLRTRVPPWGSGAVRRLLVGGDAGTPAGRARTARAHPEADGPGRPGEGLDAPGEVSDTA